MIDNLMKDTFGNEYSKRIAARNQQNITVKMIRSDENALRGFTGMNVVYINERYFKTKAFDLSLHSVGTAAEKNKILLIDIATVCIHELSHVKIRQVALSLSLILSYSNCWNAYFIFFPGVR